MNCPRCGYLFKDKADEAELLKRYSKSQQKELGKVWWVYCHTFRPYKRKASGKEGGGRGKLSLEGEEWSRSEWRSFLLWCATIPKDQVISGAKYYLSSDWVSIRGFDRLFFSKLVNCIKMKHQQEKTRKLRWMDDQQATFGRTG